MKRNIGTCQEVLPLKHSEKEIEEHHPTQSAVTINFTVTKVQFSQTTSGITRLRSLYSPSVGHWRKRNHRIWSHYFDKRMANKIAMYEHNRKRLDRSWSICETLPNKSQIRDIIYTFKVYLYPKGFSIDKVFFGKTAKSEKKDKPQCLLWLI